MEKFGCNVAENLDLQIKKLESTQFKTASETNELKDLKSAKAEIAKENN
jgi:hypothetical protein